jgi:hypothetical protein
MTARLPISLLVLGVLSSSAFLLTKSFFSDTEISKANTFIAGKIDLKLNGSDNTPAIVSFSDLKPGDNYIQHKTLYIDNNPAWVWMHMKDLVASQGAQTDSEIIEENGTPKYNIQDYLDYDLTVNNTIIINSSDHIKLPDAVSCWIPLGELPGAVDVTMDQSFHFDSAVTNWAQGDNLTFTEEFYAVQSRNNPHPLPPPPTTGRIWNPELKKCVSSCVEAWASGFDNNLQGKRKNGTTILADRTDPTKAFIAQSNGLPYDNPVISGSFFSLGFTNGSIVLTFSQPVHNITGNDLKIFEITGGTTYPDEKVKVEAWDGTTWVVLSPSLTRDSEFDLGSLSSAQKFRLTDVSNIALFESEADGFDLDGLKAFCSY